MITTIPSDQQIYVSGYYQNLFEFGSAPNDVRVCRYLNHILDLFGQDLVLAGGTVESFDIVGTTITIGFYGGKLIQDKTLVPFPAFSLDKDFAGYFGVGAYAIVYTDFQFNDTDRSMHDYSPFYFKIGIVDNLNNFIGTWDLDKNRILLCIYNIDEAKFEQDLMINGTLMHILGLDGEYNYFDFIDGGQLPLPPPILP